MIKKLFDKYREIIMYLIFGVATTVVSFLSYFIFEMIIPTISFWGITIEHTTTANVLSWLCAVLFAFVTNKIWVFESKSWKPSVAFKELVLYLSSRIATGFIEWFGLPLILKIGENCALNGSDGFFAKIFIWLSQPLFGSDGLIAKIAVSIIVVILNYVFSKLLIFKRKKTIEGKIADENKDTDEIIDDILDDIRKK